MSEENIKLLKKAGLKITEPRLTILALMQEHKHEHLDVYKRQALPSVAGIGRLIRCQSCGDAVVCSEKKTLPKTIALESNFAKDLFIRFPKTNDLIFNKRKNKLNLKELSALLSLIHISVGLHLTAQA